MLIKTVKGTKDIMPNQVYRWHYVEKLFRNIAERYGYKEIRTPLFEYTELFSRGVGDTTDIVQKEMYTFNDNKGRSLSLKPEGTASAVRAFLENKIYAEPQPTKLYYETSCYRYEEPQSGRQREFHQFGVEIFGAESMLADAEIISLADEFLKECGIEELKLRINSVGCPSCREKYKSALRDYFRPHLSKLCDTCKVRFERNPMRIIDCKSPQDKELALGAPSILNYLCDDCKASFDELKENLDTLGIEYEIDPTIVRGLDYYTKTAFEFVTEKIGAQGTVCGGGRYDNLMYEIGEQDVPGVGFGLGIERLLLLMENCGVEIPEPDGMDALIVVLGEEARTIGLKLTNELRQKGLKVEMDLMERNIKGQMKHADRLGVRYAVVIGDDEILNGEAQVRDMRISEQKSVPFHRLYEELSK
ncbi:MAG: histidine--tRNA ligase [Firmicutes bacterium]|nr:histidine--tRNA ligase [Bacillota bacterium]